MAEWVNGSELLEVIVIDFAEYIDPLSVVTKARKLVRPFAKDGHNFTVEQVAALYDYVKCKIKYLLDPLGVNYISPPRKTIKTKIGDCDDQAVLLASLCEAIGLRTRLIECNSPTECHLFAEICIGMFESKESICEQLREHYEYHVDDIGRFFHQMDSGLLWLIADTTTGRYLGDGHGLIDNRYISLMEDGSWDWYKPPKYFERKIYENSVNFFATDFDIVPFEQRNYQKYFLGKDIKYIAWQLFFRFLPCTKTHNYKIFASWYKPDGRLITIQNHDCKLEPDWKASWPSFGWGDKNGSYWQPGKYKVELLLVSDYLGYRKFSGEFEVY